MNKPTFEESYPLVLSLIRRRQAKWYYPVNWMDFGDVEMILLTHINNKWHQYDPKYPLANWVNRIISNRFKNVLRDCTRNNLFAYDSIDEDYRNTNADQVVLDFDKSIGILKEQSKNVLTPKEYRVFIELFFEKRPEIDIINSLGYKIIYKNGKAHNKTFNALVKRIYDKIKKGLATNNIDIVF